MVERMGERDWPEVSAIHTEGIATGNSTFATKTARSYGEFIDGKLPCGSLVAREHSTGAILGWTVLSGVSVRSVYAGVAEVGIYVASSARGRGVGSLLLTRLIEASEAAGVWTLQAAIFPENEPSLALHRRCGFRVVGRRERIGKMLHGPLAGEWRDTMLLERRSAVAGRT